MSFSTLILRRYFCLPRKKNAKTLDPRSPKARHKLKKKWFSRIDAILWKEIPTNLRTLPFRILKAEAELVWRLVVHHNGSKNYTPHSWVYLHLFLSRHLSTFSAMLLSVMKQQDKAILLYNSQFVLFCFNSYSSLS